MKLILNRVLPVALALAATAFAAAPASAVEVTDEASGTHCPAVTVSAHEVSGGCPLSATSDAPLELRGLFGTMIVCDEEFEMRLDEEGKGYAYGVGLTNCSSSFEPCGEPDTTPAVEEPWRVEISGAAPAYDMEMDFCVDAPLIGVFRCHLGMTFTPTGHDFSAIEAATATDTHRFCESSATNAWLGHWTVASDQAHPGIEIAD